MLGEPYFYNSIIKKSVSVFGTIFNEIFIERFDAAGNEVKLIKVPITYAAKDKVLARVDADPALTKQAAVVLPRMAFEMLSISHDGSRKLPSLNRFVALDPTNANKMYRQYVPVPINIAFALYIFVKNAEDGTKIIEQIIPWFTPDWTPTVHLIPEMGITLDTPIVINPNIGLEDTYTGTFDNRRALIYTLTFVMKTFSFGPHKTRAIIKFAENRVWALGAGDTQAEQITNAGLGQDVVIQPGLMANGAPTSNASLSIPNSVIFANSDFGFIVNYENDPESNATPIHTGLILDTE